MYTVILFTYPNGEEGEEMETEYVECEDIKSAIEYAHEHNEGLTFAGTQIENENGDLVYEITADGEPIDYRI